MEPTRDAFAPLPTVGVPFTISGGHAVVHSPEHALVVPESFVNRYNVRPCESTRIVPRPLLATPIAGFGAAFAVAAVAPPPLPTQPATSETAATTADPARRFIGLIRAILGPLLGGMGCVRSSPARPSVRR